MVAPQAEAGFVANSEHSYLAISEVATGGMGVVHLAVRREGNFQRVYALKRLHAHLRDDSAFRTMFMDEARIAGLIRHPGVVSVLDIGEDDEGPFLVMDYVFGVSAGQLLRRSISAGLRIPVQIGLRIAEQAARGLHAAHELCGHDGGLLGLVHRDVSPQNILIGFDGVVRVTDFGVAKALGRSTRTATGVIKGKFGYLAPEQLLYEEPDRRSDLYALGVVLFEILAGRRLYENRDGADGVRRALKEPPPDIGDEREDVDDDLVELVFAMLAKDRQHRPDSAKEVADRLEQMIGDRVLLEGRLDVGPWIAELFEDERTKQEGMIKAGGDRAQDAAQTSTARPNGNRSRMGLTAAIIALVVLLVAGAGIAGYTLASQAPDEVGVTQAPASVDPGPDTVEAVAEASPDDEAVAVEIPDEPEPSSPRPRPRQPRPDRPSMNGTAESMQNSQMVEPETLPNWDWQ